MGTALRNPGQLLSMLCDSASVAAGAVLVQGASNDTCALPSAANTRAKVLGLAYQAGSSSANSAISIVSNGVWAAVAGGTITRGDVLVVGGATGTVISASISTPADAAVVGLALESAVSGENVAVLIGERPRMGGVVLPFVANGAITANRIVVASTGAKVAMPGGADPVEGVVGVAANAAADTETVYVIVSGYATVTDSGSGVSAGDNLAVAGTTGTAKNAAPSAGVNSMVVGTCLTTTSASGSIPVLVNPFLMQGA